MLQKYEKNCIFATLFYKIVLQVGVAPRHRPNRLDSALGLQQLCRVFKTNNYG